jgi:hypothetical protein
MQSFKSFLKEEAEGAKLKHITHAEDRPLQSGSKGFDHAVAALNSAHDHAKSSGHSTHLSMKYDGSPSIVFGHHPETGKFFVASKSAFNKNPKINYTPKDVEKNHGHAPGLVKKLQQALTHLKKVAPKSGVYQGDVMFGDEDKKESKKGVSFTPNTITYTAKGDEADKVRKAKFGVVVHTQYHGKTAESMAADPHPDLHNFKDHPDVWTKHPAHDTSKINYSAKEQDTFKKHMEAAQKIHDESGKKMYKATEPHQGASNHLETYINHTVRTDEKPTAAGLAKHIENKYKKTSEKLKTPVAQSRKEAEAKSHIDHIEGNKEHYNNLLTMHSHLQKAKDVLVKSLESHTGGLEHHIDNKPTGPEGFVVHHAGEPTKLVNRKEFAKANLLKVRK